MTSDKHLVDLIQGIVKSDKISNAYLFVSSSAKSALENIYRFIKLQRCESNSACNKCSKCINIDQSKDIFVFKLIKINSLSENLSDENSEEVLIDDIRQLQNKLQILPPYEMRRYVIICAKSINHLAQNCLLKSLEEPPRQTTFLIYIKSVHSLLTTVTSRCQKINLNTSNENLDLVSYIADKMEINDKKSLEKCIITIEKFKELLNSNQTDSILEVITQFKELEKKRFYAKVFLYTFEFQHANKLTYNAEIADSLYDAFWKIESNLNPQLVILNFLTSSKDL
ncbi:MAG: hypothetical protein HY606_13805 [Planctomycetes bacterium]|nr:hypothetical protein [Planctomycetota bacterium]